MSDRPARTPLSDAEVQRLLRACGRRGLLVGGQALVLWARLYSVAADDALGDAVTTDADFIGTRELAKNLLDQIGDGWTLRFATLEESGGITAKLYSTAPDGYKEVDVLGSIVGLDTAKIQARAVEVELSSGTIVRVLHPLDVLESRLRNLQVLPSKRTVAGVAQARLAVQAVRGFILAALGAQPPGRVVFESVKRVRRLALDSALAIVALDHGIDVLAAIPAEEIASESFQAESWPRIRQAMDRRIDQHRALQRRRAALAARDAIRPRR